MAYQGIASQSDGPRLTVNAMINAPTTIPKIVLNMMENEFIADALLRKLPPTQSGSYLFDESTPLFATDDDAPIVGEFGEIPVISGRMGARKVAVTVKRALGVRISIEMKNRNLIDKVNTQLTQVKNTFIRTWETAFVNAIILHPDVHSVTAGTTWDDPDAAIREDLVEATAAIENSSASGSSIEDFFGFKPDTLVFGRAVRDALMLSDDFNKGYKDNTQNENVNYTGKLPGHFYNVANLMVSREMDRLAPTSAILLQAKVVGGIGDERPLQTTPTYPEGNGPNGGPRETWRSDTVRQSAVVIDQPMAACIIEDVLS